MFISFSASAGIITFNDRAAFENYVGSVTVDSLDTTNHYSSSGDLSNDDYSWTMSDYACINSSGCNSYGSGNPFVNGTNDWVWTYGSGQFLMNFGVRAFGLNYANPYNATQAQVGLNGYNSGLNANGSFFGIATDDGSLLTSISYSQFSSYQAFDNVSYAKTIRSVPESSALILFMLGLAGISLIRRKA